jgi:ABC-type polar amino acid transport system ATPase subunit
VIGNIVEAPVHVLHTAKKQAEREALELLESVGLAGAAKRYPGSLSGGEQQRVAIARALAMHPALLLLDEPTSALDPRRIHSLRTLLRTFVERGHTMLIISHSMNFLGGVADNILFMENGEMVEHGPTDQLLNSPKDARTKDFLEQAD